MGSSPTGSAIGFLMDASFPYNRTPCKSLSAEKHSRRVTEGGFLNICPALIYGLDVIGSMTVSKTVRGCSSHSACAMRETASNYLDEGIIAKGRLLVLGGLTKMRGNNNGR